METPFFLIHREKLTENIRNFRDGMQRNWPNSRLAYSVKTNSLPWVLRNMKTSGLLAEVVSDEEYELALACGFSDADIVFNGPIKTEKWFRHALHNGAWVNLDSERELEWLKTDHLAHTKIGLRINIPTKLFSEKDVGFQNDSFRFGFDVESGEFERALSIVKKSVSDPELGLHLHCNSITRSREVYRTIAAYAAEMIDRFDLRLSFLDIGGGFFGGVPGKTTPHEYFSIIAKELSTSKKTEDVLLIAEPGSAIIGSTAELHTTVLDVKDVGDARIVTTDGSRIFIDPLWSKHSYSYRTQSKCSEGSDRRQIICGYTCMDHDRLMTIDNGPTLQVGDRIIYQRVGAYSMTFSGPFIRTYPEVYVLCEDGICKIRDRFSVDTYYKLHTTFAEGEP